MLQRSSSRHGFASDISGLSSSSSLFAEKGEGSGTSGSRKSNGNGSSRSDKSNSDGNLGSSKSNGSNGKGGNSNSPEEISGQAPELPEEDSMVTAIMMTTERTYTNPNIRPVGFRNGTAPKYPSSICYRNSAMTMLLNLPYFTNWLTSGYPSDRPAEVKHPIMDTVQRLAAEYWSQLGPVDDVRALREAAGVKRRRLDISMDKFWGRFITARPNFTEKPKKKNFYRQEDAALFLMELLDFAYDELDPISTDGKVLAEMFKPWLAGSVYCSGQCQSKRKRQQRDDQSVFEEPNWIHIVNFENPLIKKKGKRSFEECFEASLKHKQDSYCSTCKGDTQRTLKHKFFKLPDILLTQLNRSTNVQGKIQIHCEIPREITVPVDDTVASKYKDHKYRLAAVVAHSGESSTAGHYVSYVRDPLKKGGWIELNDDTIRRIEFEGINHYTDPDTQQMLPYIMAWELIKDATKEVDLPETDEERLQQDIAERAMALDKREEALHRQIEELTKHLDKKELTLKRQEQELVRRELALHVPEKMLTKREREITERERKVTAQGVAVWRKAQELGEKEKALHQRRVELEQREQDLQVRREVSSIDKGTGVAPGQAGKSKSSIEHDVDSRKDTATFCASFRNADNHEENARGIFKLGNLKPNMPTKIESAVQLSDLEGNLRSIKRGTTVGDEFTITFNVKGSKKRKRRNDDDDEVCPRPKRKKDPAKQADQDHQTSPKARERGKTLAKPSTTPPRESPKPRRSIRVNRGRNPRRA